MEIKMVQQNNVIIGLVKSTEVLIADAQSALDFMMHITYGTQCKRIALNKAAISEDFFRLSTGLAGEILQKFVNYRIKFAVYGDFSCYTSQPLKDFIYESNPRQPYIFCFFRRRSGRKVESSLSIDPQFSEEELLTKIVPPITGKL